MRWRKGRRSQHIDDRREQGPRRGRTMAGGGIGIVALALVAMYFGVDPQIVMQIGAGLDGGQTQQAAAPRSAAENQLADFVSVVLADTEDTWTPIFKQLGKRYSKPDLVLFSGSTDSACGYAQAAMGPFYCPGDQKVYIDLEFYQDMKNKFGAPGDFAQAYVIAHEIGHHVQTLLGISGKVRQAQAAVSKTEGNQIQVRMELQADCLSGVWANHANSQRQMLEKGDIAEGLNAAAAIGDDRLQKQSRGYVVPESFTHGSSKQRQRWFIRGLENGDISQCDTFAAKEV